MYADCSNGEKYIHCKFIQIEIYQILMYMYEVFKTILIG